MDLRPPALLLAAALLLAGCGGGSDTKTKTTTAAGGTTIDLEQDNFYFKPSSVDVKGGTTITVNLKNEGSTAHTFTIESPAVDVTVDAGKTATAEVALPASGTVAFYCRFHQGSGMKGTLVVT
jgi:plastocyanin